MRSAKLYTEICHLLTDYDSGEHDVSIEDFYSLLVKIQNDLEYITACDYEISQTTYVSSILQQDLTPAKILTETVDISCKYLIEEKKSHFRSRNYDSSFSLNIILSVISLLIPEVLTTCNSGRTSPTFYFYKKMGAYIISASIGSIILLFVILFK